MLRWTSEELEQMQELINEGVSYSEIADRFGRNLQSIYDAVSKHGLKGKKKCKVQNEEVPITGTVMNRPLRNDREKVMEQRN